MPLYIRICCRTESSFCEHVNLFVQAWPNLLKQFVALTLTTMISAPTANMIFC